MARATSFPAGALALALAFTTPAIAGDMQCPVAPPAAPATAATQGQMGTPRGNMDNGVSAATLAEAALSLLRGVLALL